MSQSTKTEVLFSATDGLFLSTIDSASGTLSEPQRLSDVPTRWLALDPSREFLFATSSLAGGDEVPDTGDGSVVAFAIDLKSPEATLLSSQPTEGFSACYTNVTQDGGTLFVANFGRFRPSASGSLRRFTVRADGTLEGPETPKQLPTHDQGNAKIHCTVISPSGKYLAVADFGNGKILIHRMEADSAEFIPVSEISTGSGTGPRHLVFSSDEEWIYVAQQGSNAVGLIDFDPSSGEGQVIQNLPTLPEDFTQRNWLADIHLHPSGQFVYLSNRGHDSIVTYQISPETGLLSLVGHTPTEGNTPRGFGVSPKGDFIVVANQSSNDAVLFRIDPESGLPVSTGQKISINGSECVLMVSL